MSKPLGSKLGSALDVDRVCLSVSVPFLARRPIAGWIIVGIALFVLAIVPTVFEAVPYLIAGTLLTQVLAMVLTVIGIRIGASLFAAWQTKLLHFVTSVGADRLQEWIDRQNSAFYKNWGTIGFAIAFALLTVSSFWWSSIDHVAHLPLAAVIGAVTLTLTGFVCGIALAKIFFFSRFIWRVGEFPVTVSMHGFGVMSTGRVMARIYLIAAAIWLCYTTSAVWLDAWWVPMLALAAPSLILFVGSFVSCQLPLHRQMLEFKQSKILGIESVLAGLEPATPDDMTEERTKKIEYYRTKRTEILALPEWPFSFSHLATVSISGLSAIGVPLLLQFAQSLISNTAS